METPRKIRGGALYRTPVGCRAIGMALRAAEVLRVFPEGSAGVARLLDRAADAYVAGGKAGIFTPLYCFLARKPVGPSLSHIGDPVVG